MFNFLKRKMTADGIALVFARVVARILSPSQNPTLGDREVQFVAAGASTDALTLELAAFGAFNIWSGSVLALQKRKISSDDWELFQTAFWKHLDEVLIGSDVDKKCLIHRGCDFSEFMDSRMEALTAATQGVDTSTAMLSIVNLICRNLGRADSPSSLMLLVKTSYLLESGSAFDLFSKKLFVSSSHL